MQAARPKTQSRRTGLSTLCSRYCLSSPNRITGQNGEHQATLILRAYSSRKDNLLVALPRACARRRIPDDGGSNANLSQQLEVSLGVRRGKGLSSQSLTPA